MNNKIELVRGVAYINPDGTISHRVMMSCMHVEYRFDGSDPLPEGFCLAKWYMVRLERLEERL